MPTEKELIYQIAIDTATVKERMEDIREQLEGTVPKGECTQRHIVVANSIDGLKRELVAEFKKVPTGQGHQAISEEMLNRSKEDQKERKRRSILYWLTVLGTTTTLLSGVMYGAWRIFSYMNTINESLVQARREIRTGMAAGKPHVVYVTVPALTPDSGIKPLKKRPHR